MKLKKILMTAIAGLLIFSCGFEVPKDPFSTMQKSLVMENPMAELTNGGVENKAYPFTLTFTPEQMGVIKAIRWELKDSFDEVLETRVDTVVDGAWPTEYSPVWDARTNGFAAEDYKLVVTVFDAFVSEGTADEMVYTFETASFWRTFVFEFFIGRAEMFSDIAVTGLGTYPDPNDANVQLPQDTGLSAYDRITYINQNLNLLGQTTLGAEIMDKPGTRVYFELKKQGEAGKIVSPDLAPIVSETDPAAEGEVPIDPATEEPVNLLEFAWTCPDVLSDGKWIVALTVEYVGDDLQTVTTQNKEAFLLTIDTTKPVIYWNFMLNADGVTVDGNSERLTDLDINTFPSFAWDIMDFNADETQKNYFQRWSRFAFTDSSAVARLIETDVFYTATNFPLNEETQFNSFIAGVQEIEVSAWDLAGNKSDPAKRRLKVLAPADPKAVVNGGFEAATGAINTNDADTSNGSAPGWDMEVSADIFSGPTWRDVVRGTGEGPFHNNGDGKWHNHRYVTVRQAVNGYQDAKGATDTAGQYLWFSPTTVTQSWVPKSGYSNSAGYVRQYGFNLFKNVHYSFKASSWNGGSNPNPPARMALKSEDTELKFSQTGTDVADFTIIQNFSKDFPNTGKWENFNETVIPNKNTTVNIELQKVWQSGDRGWTHFDEISLTANVPSVNATILDPPVTP